MVRQEKEKKNGLTSTNTKIHSGQTNGTKRRLILVFYIYQSPNFPFCFIISDFQVEVLKKYVSICSDSKRAKLEL